MSTKDELTGQENEGDNLSKQSMHVAETSQANGDYPHREAEYQEEIGEGADKEGSTIEREMGWEELSDFDDDSDNGLKIYAV